MEDIFDKPILDQLFEFRKEEFEQAIYDKQDEIKKIEGEVCDIGDEFMAFLKKVIPNDKDYQKAFDFIRKYELSFGKEIEFWARNYYKLGINDMNKLKYELKSDNKNITKGKTFLDYTDAELDEYIQKHIDFNSETYKKYKEKCRELEEKYPRALEVFEDSTPIVLNEEEMKHLMELKEIDMELRSEETKVCFKLGISEILNF